MKRAIGALVVLGLIGGAVWIGLASQRVQYPIQDVHQLGKLLERMGYDCNSVETSIRGMMPADDVEVGICRVRHEPATLYVFQSAEDASRHRLRYQKGTDVAWVTGPNWIVALRGPRLASQIAEAVGVDLLFDEDALVDVSSHDDAELECPPGDLIQSTEADFGYDAQGFRGEPIDAVRRAFAGLRPDDEIRVHLQDFGPWAEIYRDGLRIGIVDLGWTGSGWLVASSSLCGSARIGHG